MAKRRKKKKRSRKRKSGPPALHIPFTERCGVRAMVETIVPHLQRGMDPRDCIDPLRREQILLERQVANEVLEEAMDDIWEGRT
jgi:hypothetical protein